MKKLVKKLVKKYIIKYFGSDLAAFDNRILDLEIATGLKTFCEDAKNVILKEISIKDAEYIIDISKMENTEPIGNYEKLEVGKWFKQSERFDGVQQYLICITEIDDLGVGGYGMFDGVWFNNGNCYSKDLIPASKEQIEQNLIKEAERRGFKKGVMFKSAFNGDTGTLSSDVFDYDTENNTLSCINGYPSGIFKNGIWAEIIPEEEKEIDFSVPGQFVNIADGEYSSVIVTSGKNSDETSFEGLCIKSTVPSQIGEFSCEWSKTHTTLILN